MVCSRSNSTKISYLRMTTIVAKKLQNSPCMIVWRTGSAFRSQNLITLSRSIDRKLESFKLQMMLSSLRLIQAALVTSSYKRKKRKKYNCLRRGSTSVAVITDVEPALQLLDKTTQRRFNKPEMQLITDYPPGAGIEWLTLNKWKRNSRDCKEGQSLDLPSNCPIYDLSSVSLIP